MRRRVPAILLLLFLAASLYAQAPEKAGEIDPRALFLRMVDVQDKVSYRGDARIARVLGQSKVDVRMRVYREASDKTRYDYLDAEGNVDHVAIITSGEMLSGFGGDESKWRRTKGDFETPPVFPQPDVVLRNYELSYEGMEKVAGFDTVKIRVGAKGRPSVVLYLLPDSGFRLRRQHVSTEGEVVDDRMYERIEFVERLDPATFRAPAGTEVEETKAPQALARPAGVEEQLEAARKALGDKLALPRKLPRGFELAGVRFSRSDDPKRGSFYFAHLIYCDGLATVSVFYRPDVPEPPQPRLEQAPLPEPKKEAPEEKAKAGTGADKAKKDAPDVTVRMTGGNSEVRITVTVGPPSMVKRDGCELQVQEYPSQTTVTRRAGGILYTVVGNISREELIDLIVSIDVPAAAGP